MRARSVEQPAMSMYESRTYSQILPDGKAYRFYFLQEVKSFITSPSHGMALKGSGLYEVSGIAYSGAGRIEKVMVSADGRKELGPSRASGAGLEQGLHPLPHAVALGRGPATLQSRAWDEAGNVQPTRAEFVAVRGELTKPPPILSFPNQHCNSITSWGIASNGEVKHYA